MSELLFIYKGKELVKPLLVLLARHDSDIRALDAELAKQLPADIEAARTPSGIQVRKQTTGEMAVRRLDFEKVELLAKRRETELWLFEAKRTPRAKWSLNMRDLANLYPLPRG